MRFSLNPRKRAYLKGRWAELLASIYLRFKGYEVLESRFKTPVGEIDLVVRKGNILIAIEVKSRHSYESAARAVTPLQQRRIERALLYYLARKPSRLNLRFDVILISRWRWPCHIQGAWIS